MRTERTLIKWSPWLIPMTAAASEIAIRWGQFDSFYIEPHTALMGRLFAGFVLLATLIWATYTASRHMEREFCTTWFDLNKSGGTDDPGWEEVFLLASLDGDADPIALKKSSEPKFSGEMRLKVAVLCPCWVSIGILFAAALDYDLFPRVPGFLRAGDHIPDITTNLTAYLALIAAAVSIGFTYHQLRAKVRADARQVWISKLRNLLAAIIADITELKADWQMKPPADGTADSKEAWRKPSKAQHYERLNRNRLLLELMLNPSEKDHRLLTIVIRALVVPGIWIAGDQYVASDIVADSKSWKNQRLVSEPLHAIAAWRASQMKPTTGGLVQPFPLSKDNWNEVISHLVKLAHVILKREWERVRHTR